MAHRCRLHGAYSTKDPKEAAQFGVKVIVVDIPRPKYMLPSVGPGDPLPVLPPPEGSNGHKPQE